MKNRLIRASRTFLLAAAGLFAMLPLAGHADDTWILPGADGQPEVQLYFFWSLTCPHCTDAHPYIEAIPKARPWVRLHALELSRDAENVRLYRNMARQLGEKGASVPAWLFCGEMHVGWESDETTGAMLRRRLDACRARALGGQTPETRPEESIRLLLLGSVDAASLSLPALTLILAGLDAFNPWLRQWYRWVILTGFHFGILFRHSRKETVEFSTR
ncbi:MAG: hypothetical protein NUV63_04030, partial [Gallionella sp.]|nr:hypothetical protein [Gallionella sp.]